MSCTQLSWLVNDKRLYRVWSVCHRQLLLLPEKRGTLCDRNHLLYIYVLNILVSKSLWSTLHLCVVHKIESYWVMFCIWLHWMRCVCSRLVFSTFRLLTVVFLLVHTVFVEDINYESCIVICYPRKTLTSKIMPIKARIFWNAIAVPGSVKSSLGIGLKFDKILTLLFR